MGDAGIERATLCISRRFEGRDNPIGGGPERSGLLTPNDRPETAGVRPKAKLLARRALGHVELELDFGLNGFRAR